MLCEEERERPLRIQRHLLWQEGFAARRDIYMCGVTNQVAPGIPLWEEVFPLNRELARP